MNIISFNTHIIICNAQTIFLEYHNSLMYKNNRCMKCKFKCFIILCLMQIIAFIKLCTLIYFRLKYVLTRVYYLRILTVFIARIRIVNSI